MSLKEKQAKVQANQSKKKEKKKMKLSKILNSTFEEPSCVYVCMYVNICIYLFLDLNLEHWLTWLGLCKAFFRCLFLCFLFTYALWIMSHELNPGTFLWTSKWKTDQTRNSIRASGRLGEPATLANLANVKVSWFCVLRYNCAISVTNLVSLVPHGTTALGFVS